MRLLDKVGHKWRAAFALVFCLAGSDARAWSFKVLHTFTGTANDGANPAFAGLITDKAGNLYGTTAYGGAYGNGVVFRLAPDGTFAVLHSFNGSDGYWPYGGVIRDNAGNLYGTTLYGGANGDGVAFKLAPDGTLTVLHSFAGDDGEWPFANLTRDKADNLYGTTSQGGVGRCQDWSDGCGTAFQIAPDGTFTKLHDFTSDDGEEIPLGTLARDKAGNLYGTTNGCPYYAGTLFKLAPDGAETILYSFDGVNTGSCPWAGPIRDRAGNLYGTGQIYGVKGYGVVYELAPDGTATALHSFNRKNGDQPVGTLVRDKAGNLYCTTYQGGAYGGGVAFRVKADRRYRVLHNFDCADDGGCGLYAGLVKDGAGTLYGTTISGGAYNQGTVFALMK